MNRYTKHIATHPIMVCWYCVTIAWIAWCLVCPADMGFVFGPAVAFAVIPCALFSMGGKIKE